MEVSEEERVALWDVTGANTYVWCHIILITEDGEKEIAKDHFKHDPNKHDSFIKIADKIQKTQTTTKCIIEYRIYTNKFPHAIIQDQITDTLSQVGSNFKSAKIRFSLFFAATAHMMVKRLFDWLTELRINGVCVLVGPILVSQQIAPPLEISRELKYNRIKEDSLVLRKLWATFICLSKNLISEKVVFMSEYSGNDYNPSSVEKSFSREVLNKFNSIMKMFLSMLSDNSTPYSVKDRLQIAFPPFCLIFKQQQQQQQDPFSKSIDMEPILMKYNQNCVFQKVSETIQQICIDLKITKLQIRKVSLLLNLVSEQSRLVTESLWNVVDELQAKYPYGKGVKNIIKESLMKIQIPTKDVTMETQKNAECELHKLNQSSIELDYGIRELNLNIERYSIFRINFQYLMKILVKLEGNFEGNDLLLILEKVNYFCLLSGSYEAGKYLTKQQIGNHGMQTSDIEFIEKIVTRVSKEIEWIEMQLEQKPELISKTNHGYVTKRQEFLQLLRKQQTIKHTLECELDNARGKTAKGEEAQLYRFSFSLKYKIGKESFTPLEQQTTTTTTTIKYPHIHTDIEAYLELTRNPKEDSAKRISDFASNIQIIEVKLTKLANLLYLEDSS